MSVAVLVQAEHWGMAPTDCLELNAMVEAHNAIAAVDADTDDTDDAGAEAEAE